MKDTKEKTETLAQMQTRLAALEQELQVLRYRIKLKKGELTQPQVQVVSPQLLDSEMLLNETAKPVVLLRALAAYDPLSAKWRLGEGLPAADALSPAEKKISVEQVKPPPARGKLRLFGLLSSGEPWQSLIELCDLDGTDGKIIGSSTERADIVLDEVGVSREHARFLLENGMLVVSDLGSTNGVLVDGRKQPAYMNTTPLLDGMVLGFGPVELRVEIVD